MKIVLLSPFYPLRGGIAQFADELSDELALNHEVVRVSYKRQYPNFLFPGKTQYVENVEASSSKAIELLDSVGPLSWMKVNRFLRKQNAEVVLIAYWMPFMVPALWLSIFGLSAKKVALVHNYQSHDGKKLEKKVTNFLLRKQNKIVALSTLVKTQIQQEMNVEVEAIPHPTYSQFGKGIEKGKARQTLGLDPSKKIVLFFGLIRPYKGLDTLIEAFKYLPDDHFLLIAGEAYGKAEEWQMHLEGLGSDRFLWHNSFISDDAVSNYFSAADVCVLPYKSATQSGVTAVAHHFYLPVIATNVGGLKEFIRSGENGDLVPAENPSELARKIAEYFEQNKYQRYSKVLQDEGGLTWAEFANRLVHFLEA